MTSKPGFNQDLGKQFVPFWNGLIHLVGRVEQGTILRRFDWNNIIQECENFERDYLNTSNFCESCLFSQIPSFLETSLEEADKVGIQDCKKMAQDNDLIYLYCIEKKFGKKKVWLVFWIVFFVLICIIVGFIIFQRYKKHDLSKQFYPHKSVLFSNIRSLPVRNMLRRPSYRRI